MREILDLEITEIATRTPLRTLETPGIVSVLHGDELRKAGYRSVMEALEEIPGVFRTSADVIVIRGLGHVWGSGKIQYQLNGVPISESVAQVFAPHYVPIEMVERIEIIRGPGSALYGKGAFLAVINVVTRTEEDILFAEVGSFDSYRLGGTMTLARPIRQFSANLAIAYQKRNDRNITISEDVLYGTPFEPYSEAPGVDNNAMESPLTGVLDLQYGGFRLLGQVLTAKFGDNLGLSGALSPPSDGMAREFAMALVETSWQGQLVPWFRNRFRLGYREYEWDNNEHLYPAGFLGLPNPIRGGPHYEEHSLYGGVETYLGGPGPQELLLGIEFESVATGNTWQYFNYIPTTSQPVPAGSRFSGEQNWLAEDIERDILSVYLQDQITLATGTRITAGLRYDRYSDTGDRWVPRLAVVHPFPGGHSLKAQYAEAFRPPSFAELYTRNNPVIQGNPQLDPEDIATLEVGYLYAGTSFRWDLVIFHSRLSNLINATEGTYANGGDAISRGAEASFDSYIGASVSVNGTLAYVDARDDETNEPVPGSVNWLADLRVNYRPTSRRTVAVSIHYQGKGYRAPGDERRRADDATTFDISVTEDDFLFSGLTLAAGLTNFFDEDAPRQSLELPRDPPGTGRIWWTRLTHHF